MRRANRNNYSATNIFQVAGDRNGGFYEFIIFDGWRCCRRGCECGSSTGNVDCFNGNLPCSYRCGILFSVNPPAEEAAKADGLVSSLEIGDSVLTTAGFYGVVIDVMEEVIVVEFGNNKNCRIPMKKTAVVEVEKPEGAVAAETKEKK